VRELIDFKIYLDISDEVKFAWKIQRDMAERGHSLESIKASIEARKPDFDAYIDVQKKHADVVIQARPRCAGPGAGPRPSAGNYIPRAQEPHGLALGLQRCGAHAPRHGASASRRVCRSAHPRGRAAQAAPPCAA
jgi:hypothetical protein